MLVPVVRKIIENKKCFTERVFPVDGVWGVQVGDFVEPFDHLGGCSFSQNRMMLPESFKPEDFKTKKKFYYIDTLLGKVKKEKIFTPYDGNLIELANKRYVFEENERKYVLLSGVWGSVKSLHDTKSALIETQTKDILFSFSTEAHVSGELVVFPNPSDILKKSYLENFVKGVKGKIIYIGNYVSLDVVKRAYELGAAAVISGSAHSEVFEFAKRYKFAFGIFSGFGNIRTPEDIYKFLSSVSYRYVFFEGAKNLLRVPIKAEDLTVTRPRKSKKVEDSFADSEYVKNIEAGMRVQVFQTPYFGWSGVVDSVSESSIFVKFGLDNRAIEIRSPNFLIVE